MKAGDTVRIMGPRIGDTRFVTVVRVERDYAYLDTEPAIQRSGVRAFHRRTGKPRRANGWLLADVHLDPRAGRGTTR
jgi:hypothetical protein